MKHILVIDDDVPIGDMVEEVLVREGYRVSRAYSGTEGRLALTSCRPDLILLDLMLPGLSGEQLLPELKDIPVIVVSAKADVENKVGLLLGGAADYITKPFDIRELLARITVCLRRSAQPQSTVLAYGGIRLDTASREVSAGGREARLTRTEFAILKLLLCSPGQVITKSALLDRISSDTPDCTETSLKMHVSNLRRKLRDAGGRDCIEAVWGIGFRLTGGA
ncbi:MAG: response regulator transcription factor [Oscillospiraceae bacterium]|nr:response regulator transcription factor [Oscillospiraceae bacterium]